MKFKLPFNNPNKAIIGIVIVIALFTAYAAWGEEHDHLELAAGPTFTGEFNGGMGINLSKRFHKNFDAGVTLVSDQSWDDVAVGNNGSFWARFVVHRPEAWSPYLPSEVHIGANYWFKAQAPINGCKEGYLLGLTWDLPEWFAWMPDNVGVDHRSNSGTCKPNRGQDLLMFGWRF